MIFNSLAFAVFLPAVFGLYWLVPRRWQNLVLLAASYVFYGAWDPRFLSLLALSTCLDFAIARRIAASPEDARRKGLLATSLLINLGILGTFKYYGFFVDSAIELLNVVGFDPHRPVLEVVLPVGISFYTFQTLSYTFDVYRRRIGPTEDLFAFGVYVAYFPQLVAGPIERARRLLPQIQHSRGPIGTSGIRAGVSLILLGLFKKVAIADPVGLVADTAFRPGGAGGATALLGMMAFAIQIYGDFSGYSDMARGTSRLFGIELMRNFEQPYLSRNITEFWRTWHISLSTWLHDYLYVPLGGNRRGHLATYRNLMLTMLLGGLWHGASWSFVVWGGCHGLLLAAHRRLGGYIPRGRPDPIARRDIPGVIATFSMVGVLWVFFRAPTLRQAFDYLGSLSDVAGTSPSADHLLLVLGSALAMAAIDVAQRNSGSHGFTLERRPALRGAIYATLVLLVLVWAGGEARPFLYFQF